MPIIIKSRHRFLFVMFSIVTSVCVATFSGDEESTTHIEIVFRDSVFWDQCVSKAEAFFKMC